MPDGEWSIAEYRGVEGLKALEPAWRHIFSEMPMARSHDGWDAAYAYALHLAGHPKALRYYAISNQSGVRAIVPAETRLDCSMVVPASVVGSPLPCEGPEGDIIAIDAAAAAVAIPLVLGAMRDAGLHQQWFVVGPVPTESTAWEGVRSSRIHAAVFSRGSRDYIETRGTYEAHMASLKKNFRANLRKARNKLSALEDVRFVTARAADDVSRELEAFFELEASGWKGRTGTGTAIVLIPHVADWYRTWFDALAHQGRCEINALYVGEQCIASELCVKTRDVYEMLKIAYDESFAHFAPGQMLMEHTLKRCFEDPLVATVDLVSDAPWHVDWGVCSRPMSMAWVARSAFVAAFVPIVRFRFGPVRRQLRQLRQSRVHRPAHVSAGTHPHP